MRPFRLTRAFIAAGQCARQNPSPFRPLSAPRLLTCEHSFLQPANTFRMQTRLESSIAAESPSKTTPHSTKRIPPTDNSNIQTLFAPYRFSDLTQFEQEAYYTYGPNYLEHLEPKLQAKAQRSLRNRKRYATTQEAALGSDWYPIVKAFDKERDQKRNEFHEQINKKKAEVVKTREFPEDLPQSEKDARERQATKAYASIRAEVYEFYAEERSAPKKAARLRQLAERFREQQTA